LAHIALEGIIDDDVASAAVDALDIVAQAQLPFVLFEINSPGGSVDAGFKIAKAIENSPAKVVCVVDGEADSMAFYILQSCDMRIMTYRSILMAHEPAVGIKGYGKSDDWKKRGQELADMLAVLTRAFNHHCSQRLTISYDEYSKRVHNTEYWIDDDEATAIGAIDMAVVSVKQVEKMLMDAIK